METALGIIGLITLVCVILIALILGATAICLTIKLFLIVWHSMSEYIGYMIGMTEGKKKDDMEDADEY